MKSVFISDLHLSSDQPLLFTAFSRFVDALPEDVAELYILGDLFEAWIGDDDRSDFANSVRAILSKVTARGIKLKLQRGNRDFLLGKQFAADTGGEIIGDSYLFNQYGHQAVLMHGDLLCTDDQDYQRFRRKVHRPWFNFILRNLPISQRQKIAKKWRSQSKIMNKNKPENIMDVNTDAVINCLNQHRVNTLIHGHTHRPAVHSLQADRRRIVLGDWGEHLWWIQASQQGFELLSKPINSNLSGA